MRHAFRWCEIMVVLGGVSAAAPARGQLTVDALVSTSHVSGLGYRGWANPGPELNLGVRLMSVGASRIDLTATYAHYVRTWSLNYRGAYECGPTDTPPYCPIGILPVFAITVPTMTDGIVGIRVTREFGPRFDAAATAGLGVSSFSGTTSGTAAAESFNLDGALNITSHVGAVLRAGAITWRWDGHPLQERTLGVGLMVR